MYAMQILCVTVNLNDIVLPKTYNLKKPIIPLAIYCNLLNQLIQSYLICLRLQTIKLHRTTSGNYGPNLQYREEED